LLVLVVVLKLSIALRNRRSITSGASSRGLQRFASTSESAAGCTP